MASKKKPFVVPVDQPVRVYDLRWEQSDPPALPKPKHRIIRGKVAKRDMRTITGVTIHQTACVFGVSDAGVKRASGDVELATARRALGVACHGLAFTGGFYALPNPLDWYVWHANALNETTLGLEVEGLYAGLEDDPDTVPREDLETTWNGPPMKLTDETVASARACLARLVNEARAAGAPLTNVFAHRQSSDTRRSDPGEAIWQKVVLDYAVPVLGLTAKPSAVFGPGRPIPVEWAPDGVRRY